VATQREEEVLHHAAERGHKLQVERVNDQWTATGRSEWCRRPASDPVWSGQHRAISPPPHAVVGAPKKRGERASPPQPGRHDPFAGPGAVAHLAALQTAGGVPACHRDVVPGQAIEAAPDEIS